MRIENIVLSDNNFWWQIKIQTSCRPFELYINIESVRYMSETNMIYDNHTLIKISLTFLKTKENSLKTGCCFLESFKYLKYLFLCDFEITVI